MSESHVWTVNHGHFHATYLDMSPADMLIDQIPRISRLIAQLSAELEF